MGHIHAAERCLYVFSYHRLFTYVYGYNVTFIILYKIDKGTHNTIFIIIINVKPIYHSIITTTEDRLSWGNPLLYCIYIQR